MLPSGDILDLPLSFDLVIVRCAGLACAESPSRCTTFCKAPIRHGPAAAAGHATAVVAPIAAPDAAAVAATSGRALSTAAAGAAHALADRGALPAGQLPSASSTRSQSAWAIHAAASARTACCAPPDAASPRPLRPGACTNWSAAAWHPRPCPAHPAPSFSRAAAWAPRSAASGFHHPSARSCDEAAAKCSQRSARECSRSAARLWPAGSSPHPAARSSSTAATNGPCTRPQQSADGSAHQPAASSACGPANESKRPGCRHAGSSPSGSSAFARFFDGLQWPGSCCASCSAAAYVGLSGKGKGSGSSSTAQSAAGDASSIWSCSSVNSSCRASAAGRVSCGCTARLGDT